MTSQEHNLCPPWSDGGPWNKLYFVILFRPSPWIVESVLRFDFAYMFIHFVMYSFWVWWCGVDMKAIINRNLIIDSFELGPATHIAWPQALWANWAILRQFVPLGKCTGSVVHDQNPMKMTSLTMFKMLDLYFKNPQRVFSRTN
jgi:hypothetical protein